MRSVRLFTVARAALGHGGAAVDPEEPVAAAPVVTSVAPSSGLALTATSITVTGTDFVSGATITIDGALCTSTAFVDSTELTCNTPDSLAAGTYDIVVTNPDEQDSGVSGAGLFEFVVASEASSYLWRQDTLTAPWEISDGCVIVYLPVTGKYWRYFGWGPYGGGPISTTNASYSSPDRVTWTLEHAHEAAPATVGAGAYPRPRHTPSTFMHTDADDVLWAYFVGGDHLDAAYFGFGVTVSDGYASDIWRTSDGVTMERVLASDDAPWAGRMLVAAGSHNGSIWVTGGVSGLLVGPTTAFNDLYRSDDDGFAWSTVLTNAAASASRWSARGIVSKLVSFQGRLVMCCGGTYDDDQAARSYFDEIWSTVDGSAGWTQHASIGCTPRQYVSVDVHEGRLFLVAGFASVGGTYSNVSDAWSTDDLDGSWFDHGMGPFWPSHGDGLCSGPDGLTYMAGNGTIASGGVTAVYTLTPTALPTTPDRTGMVVWCEAEWADVDEAAERVLQVADRSSFSRHNGSYSVSNRPRYFASDPYNGGSPSWGTLSVSDEALLLWNRTDSSTTNSATPYSIAGPHTVFYVVTLLSGGANNAYFVIAVDLDTTGAPSLYGSAAGGSLNCHDGNSIGSIPITLDEAHVVCVVYDDGGNSAGYIDDMTTPVFAGTTAAGTAWVGNILGASPGEPTRYRMSALVGFQGILADGRREDWGDYLTKYAA